MEKLIRSAQIKLDEISASLRKNQVKTIAQAQTLVNQWVDEPEEKDTEYREYIATLLEQAEYIADKTARAALSKSPGASDASWGFKGSRLVVNVAYSW
jgi:hypothetical protein